MVYRVVIGRGAIGDDVSFFISLVAFFSGCTFWLLLDSTLDDVLC